LDRALKAASAVDHCMAAAQHPTNVPTPVLDNRRPKNPGTHANEKLFTFHD